jgi:hypothetical protein
LRFALKLKAALDILPAEAVDVPELDERRQWENQKETL